MTIRKLFQNREERAVSPVIGVILMVAITVILAAVIGMFVLGLGDDLGNSSGPQATMSFDYEDSNVTIQHGGGDAIDKGDLTLIVDGTEEGTVGNAGEMLAGGENAEVAYTGSATGEVDVSVRHDPSGTVVGSGTIDLSSPEA